MEQLAERVWYAPGGVNIGVVVGDGGEIVMIDSGLNDTAARKVLRWVRDELRGRVAAIVTTHAHADHFGGNAFVVKRTRAKIYAPAWDEAVLRYPLMQAVSLFGGADPPLSLRGPFLVAEASPVDAVYTAGPFEIGGVTFEAVSLAGHSPNQMGILVDGVFFCADVVLPERVLEKYRMPYLYSVTEHLAALDRAAAVTHSIAVPGHGPLLEHSVVAVEPNRRLANEVAEIVVDICRDPTTPEDVLAKVLTRLRADSSDAPSLFLLHPTVFAYLSHLERVGRLRHEIDGGRSLWSRV